MKLGAISGLSPEEAFERIQTWARNTGTISLANKRDTARRTITITGSFEDYTFFKTGFTATGGLIRIEAYLLLFAGAPIQTQIRLLVDGEEVQKRGELGQDIGVVPLVYEAFLKPGTHTVKIQSKASGTINFNDDGVTTGSVGDSNMIIKEILGVE